MTGQDDPRDVLAVWAMAQGLAELMAAGRLQTMESLAPADRQRAFADILARSIPG